MDTSHSGSQPPAESSPRGEGGSRTDSGLTRRRLMQAVGASAGLLAGATTLGSAVAANSVEVAKPAPFTPRGKLRRRPNFLVVVVDEMRAPAVYESEALKRWRRQELKTLNAISRRGFSFDNHQIMSAACAPSRTSFFTGQYPSLHGVTQTDGAAKAAVEEDLYWLDPTTVPTMGHYFRAAGYETFYKGKWHISHADLIQPGTWDALPSYDAEGRPDADLEKVYLEADRLDAYGFTGWVGPEPHGQSPLNSGSSNPTSNGRDAYYASQGVEQLRRLRQSNKPWLLVTSFVDPHDITIWGNLTLASRNYYLAQQLQGSSVPRDLFDSRYDTSSNEDLSGKPTAQASYRGVYEQAFQPTENNDAYRRFYYQLHANVDQQIGKVVKALKGGGTQFYRDTIVVFVSDHGELLGAHGGLFQKWHQAYDEVLRVPLVFHNPSLFPKAKATDVLTSHADLLPTMLGLAGADMKKVRRQLKRTHTQVREFPGRDLSGLLLGEKKPDRYKQPVYFMTDDEPTRGANQETTTGVMYAAVTQPCHVETVIAKLPTGPNGAPEQWKYNRYWDNPAFWSVPGVRDVVTMIEGNVNTPGDKQATTTVKTTPVPDQVEVYNMTKDPTEMNDLARDSRFRDQIAELAALLVDQRDAKRLEPRIRRREPGVPGGVGV